jgi:hypothetical protein
MNQPDITYSIFVSATGSDSNFRARARDAVLTHNMRPLVMEYFPAEAGATEDVLHRYLDMADGVVVIAGARYGRYVEWEFEQAVVRGIPVICLILSKSERARCSVANAEREKQERFIQRLRKQSKPSDFDETTLDRELSGLLSVFPRQVRPGAGLIRVTEYEDSLDLTSSQLRDLRSHQTLLRLLSGIGLISGHSRYYRGGARRSMSKEDEREILDRLLDLLYEDLVDRPVATRIIESLLRGVTERLHGFSTPSGFIPASVGELTTSLDELFGETLSTLKATSIHSNTEALVAYKGYWNDSELGPFFKQKNEQFLARRGDRKILRVYACDSVANSVAEEWFADTAMSQVSQGAVVKVVEINPSKITTYDDFGIYEHSSARNSTGYLLLAPRERNLHQRGLTTSITVDSDTIGGYSRKFETLWDQAGKPIEILKSDSLDEADHQPLSSHGQGKIKSIFGGRIVLRRMERLDTKESLLTSSAGFLRKYRPQYAKAISEHLKSRYPDVTHLFYVGDTYKNDGTLIRNLQTLGWDTTGFICEPKLRIARLLFNNILYTNRWTDLVGVTRDMQTKAGPNMLAIFDIDQTLWAPKGVHEGPLITSRIRAMSRLVDEYVADPDSDVARRAKARVKSLYREISEVKYHPFTLDNEDFKAVICVFLGLNLLFDQHRLESGGREAGAAFFEELGRLGTKDFLELTRTKYLPPFTRSQRDDEANITHFIMETLSTAQTYQYSLYGETNGILVAKVVDHLRDVFRETIGNAPIQYATFRAKEFEETLSCAGGNGRFDDQLVLNKPVWDVAIWLERRGAHLLALSDRPDESTVSPSGESLLDTTMTIYGKDISHLLASDTGT